MNNSNILDHTRLSTFISNINCSITSLESAIESQRLFKILNFDLNLKTRLYNALKEESDIVKLIKIKTILIANGVNIPYINTLLDEKLSVEVSDKALLHSYMSAYADILSNLYSIFIDRVITKSTSSFLETLKPDGNILKSYLNTILLSEYSGSLISNGLFRSEADLISLYASDLDSEKTKIAYFIDGMNLSNILYQYLNNVDLIDESIKNVMTEGDTKIEDWIYRCTDESKPHFYNVFENKLKKYLIKASKIFLDKYYPIAKEYYETYNKEEFVCTIENVIGFPDSEVITTSDNYSLGMIEALEYVLAYSEIDLELIKDLYEEFEPEQKDFSSMDYITDTFYIETNVFGEVLELDTCNLTDKVLNSYCLNISTQYRRHIIRCLALCVYTSLMKTALQKRFDVDTSFYTIRNILFEQNKCNSTTKMNHLDYVYLDEQEDDEAPELKLKLKMCSKKLFEEIERIIFFSRLLK